MIFCNWRDGIGTEVVVGNRPKGHGKALQQRCAIWRAYKLQTECVEVNIPEAIVSGSRDEGEVPAGVLQASLPKPNWNALPALTQNSSGIMRPGCCGHGSIKLCTSRPSCTGWERNYCPSASNVECTILGKETAIRYQMGLSITKR